MARHAMARTGVRPRSRALASCLVLLAGIATADDSELFLGDAAAISARANVLFIIDTSGSMDTLVATQAPFDSGNTFAGCFDSDALYYATTGALPACDSTSQLPKSLNRCATGDTPLARTGSYSDRFLVWDPDRARWDLPSPASPAGPLECESDRGVDGDRSTARPFAANGADGPWAADATAEPAWTTRYTVYDGNWLNWRSNPPTVQQTRLDVVKVAVNGLLAGLRDVNVGLMRFSGDEGGAVVYAMEDIELARNSLPAVVNALQPGGGTPLSEALYEATLYLTGGGVDYGNLDPVRSVAGSRLGNTPSSPLYRSPITEDCGRNFIILLTDGEPFDDNGADSRIVALPEFSTLVAPDCDGSGDGRCLDDLAAYLLRKDLNPDLPGLQNAVTYTIGFDQDFPLLQSTAARGGGNFYLADDTASLSTALSGIVLSIADSAGTFASPTVPVDAYNRAQNLGDVFLSVFQPTGTARWIGNLKKYRLEDGQLVGQDGRPAINEATGTFSRDAFSFWSSEPDGDQAGSGGAASRLPSPSSRVLVTNLAGNDLSVAGNRVSTANGGLLAALAGVPVDEREDLVDWALGRDVRDADGDGSTGEARQDMGDALHVQPLTLLYGGSADLPVATVFLATNDGYLHAFDTETGNELWAFIPARLLNNLYTLFRNEPVPTKQYGLDGEINLVILNDDGRPGLNDGEQAILLFGMGRGGDGVFAVDVTSRTAPRLLWEINSSDPQFADLGYTWSSPTPARVRIGSTTRPVAVFGGGYDPGQDNRSFRTDTIGNAIYIVDVLTGARLWSAGSTAAVGPHDLQFDEMQHSIPAPTRPVDISGDGLADRLYVGDMGGRLWRFDIINGEPRDSLVSGGVIAALGAAGQGITPPAADLRRFYAAPDVAPVIIDRQLVLSINIGSGYRGHPLDTTIDEAFYSVRDFDVFNVKPAAGYAEPLTVDDLVDITDDPAPSLLADAAGWQLRLVQGAGEKVLGESLTLENTIFFTSFTPGETASACTSGAGTNRLYAVSVFDGRPRTNFDSPVGEPLTVADRSRTLLTGIPILTVTRYQGSTPEDNRICAGTECLSDEEMERLGLLRSAIRRTYWFQDESR